MTVTQSRCALKVLVATQEREIYKNKQKSSKMACIRVCTENGTTEESFESLGLALPPRKAFYAQEQRKTCVSFQTIYPPCPWVYS